MFPPPLLPRGPGFIQHGHHTSTQELCSFSGPTWPVPRTGPGWQKWASGGGKGEILGDPRSSFACCHYFTTWGRSPPFRKGKKEGLKKLMKILEGGGRGPWSQGLPKKKKMRKAHPLALELKRGVCGCLKKYARKVIVSTHSFQGTITTTR